MKWFLVVGVLAAAYYVALTHTTDTVMRQLSGINQTYQYIGDNTDDIANGEKPLLPSASSSTSAWQASAAAAVVHQK
jgi:hypothetical protein